MMSAVSITSTERAIGNIAQRLRLKIENNINKMPNISFSS